MAGLPRLPRLPQERAAKVRLPRVQRDRHGVPRLLVETSEGVEALPDFLIKPEQASTSKEPKKRIPMLGARPRRGPGADQNDRVRFGWYGIDRNSLPAVC